MVVSDPRHTECSKSHKSKMSVIYIYIYICNHENNFPTGLLPQWICVATHDLEYMMCGCALPMKSVSILTSGLRYAS